VRDLTVARAGRRAWLAAAAALALGTGRVVAGTAVVREIGWGGLVPSGWDASRAAPSLPPEAAALDDADPRAKAMLASLRRALDEAPVVASLQGETVRLPGYVVPLALAKGGIREFLLVPYLGACIHSPPPAANQIVRCRAERPVTGVRAMEAVWATGRLDVARTASPLGVAGYGLRVHGVERQG
jgi:hypothetical protein